MMTLAELLEKGEGTVYLVKAENPTCVVEFDVVAITKLIAQERHYFYFSYEYYYNRGELNGFILARKSKDKKRHRLDGHPTVVSFNGIISYIPFERDDLGKNSLNYKGYKVFLDKEKACDYAINKLKQKKLELNGLINKVNKFKFSLV